jgi:succinate-semialdehyde dehydrogenase/glutarate-semialdehyde dehydrogenase
VIDHLNDEALYRTKSFINGLWVDADDGATLEVTNPVNGDVLARVAKVGASETRTAIKAAASAMSVWRAVPAKVRSNILRDWFNLIMAHQEDLARIMTLEQGKIIAESRGEVAYGASYIEWFAEQAKRIEGDVIPGPSPDKRIVCIKQPVGVCAAITPWNFPNAMIHARRRLL